MSAPLLEHSADGIEELDNPLPRWWLYSFYLTIAFSIVYGVMYPTFWFWNGTTGWNQEKQWAATKVAKKAGSDLVDLSALAQQPGVRELGEKVFKSNCASCHGVNAEGKIGPSLTDATWKYGNDDKNLLHTIQKGRPGGMPAWGTFLKGPEVQAVAAYVKGLSK